MKKDHLKYYWSKFTKWLQDLLVRLMTATSFLAIVFILVFILYHLFVAFSSIKVITGCITLCVMRYLNESL